MNTITATITYRKTRDGEWCVFGPRDILAAHVITAHELGECVAGYRDEASVEPVTVTKKNGDTKTEWVRHLSRGFDVDGVEHAYGYLHSRTDIAAAANAAVNRNEH